MSTLRFFVVGLLVVTSVSNACDLPQHPSRPLERKQQLLTAFCLSHTVALVNIRDVWDNLDVDQSGKGPDGVVQTPTLPITFGAHYEVVEDFKGNASFNGFLFGNRQGASCGNEVKKSEKWLVFLPRTPSLYQSLPSFRIDASAGDAILVESDLETLRKIGNDFRTSSQLCRRATYSPLKRLHPNAESFPRYPGPSRVTTNIWQIQR
jgi:hypothetical protein